MKGKKILFTLIAVLALCLGLSACNITPEEPFTPVAINTIATTYTNNQAVQAEGVVYAVQSNGFYLSDAADGHIFVVRGDSWTQDVEVGDKVQVTGKFGYAKNIIQIKDVTKCEKVSSGNTPSVVATEVTLSEVAELSNDDRTVFGKLVTLVGLVEKTGTMYTLTDEEGATVRFDEKSNTTVLETLLNSRVTLNAIVSKYLVSENIWTVAFLGKTEDAHVTPYQLAYVVEETTKHINNVVAKNIYGALELPSKHPSLFGVTYAWTVETNDYVTINGSTVKVVTDENDHEIVLKLTVSYNGQSEEISYPIISKGIVEQTVSEFYTNEPVYNGSKVIVRGIVVSTARNQSLSTRSLVLKDPVTNETVSVDFSNSGSYILHTSNKFKEIKVGDEIVVTATYSLSGRPTIDKVTELEITSSNNEFTHDYENAYVLSDEESYTYFAKNVYDFSGQLVKIANPYINYSVSENPNDTSWVTLGYNETVGAKGYSVDETNRKFALQIAANNENLGHDLWHKYFEVPFSGQNGKQFGLEIYAYCLYVSDSYVAFIIPDQASLKFADGDQISIDLATSLPSSIETETIELLSSHELAGTLTWTSSNNEVVNVETGAIAEVKENTVVTLTATYTLNGEQKSFSKDVTVLASNPISVSELLANAIDGGKYKGTGVVVAFGSNGNSSGKDVAGVVVMDPVTNQVVLVNGINVLTGTNFPDFKDQTEAVVAIGSVVEFKGVYSEDQNSISVGTGKFVITGTSEVAVNDENVLVIDSNDALANYAKNFEYGQILKFVGTTEAPIYFGGSSTSSPMNVKVFMNNAKDNDGTKYEGLTFTLKTDTNEANAGTNWHVKYLALPKAFVAPKEGSAARSVTGTIYCVVTHKTSSYYQMAIVVIDQWTAQPELQYVKNQIVEGLDSSVSDGDFKVKLPSSTQLAGEITWTSSSELIDLENKTVAKVEEDTEVTLTGTFTYGGETQTVEHVVVIKVPAPATVSEAKQANEGEILIVEGLVVGFGGNGTWAEVYLMDSITGEFIGLKSTEKLKKGDIIKFKAKVTISENPTEKGKKYLSDATGLEVVSSNNPVNIDLSKAISVSTQEQLSEIHQNEEYVLYKLEGEMRANMYDGDRAYSTAYFRLHFNLSASKLSECRFKNEAGNDISAGLRNSYIAKNLGEDWAVDVFGCTKDKYESTYPGFAFNGTIYVLYTGGNKYYETLIILDSSHVIKAQ